MAVYICILNIFLAFLILINNWKVNRNSLYLCLLVVLISTFSLTHYLVIYGHSAFWLAIMFNNLTPFWCLTGPALFFYVRGVITDKFEFRTIDLMHTVPFFATLIGVIPYWLTPFAYKLKLAEGIITDMNLMKTYPVNWLVPQEINLLVRPVMHIVYSLFCLVATIRFFLKNRNVRIAPVRQFQFVVRWIFGVTIFMLLIGLYYFISLILYYRHPELGRGVVYEFEVFYTIGILLIFIPFLMIIFPEILYGIPRYQLREAIQVTGPIALHQELTGKKIVVSQQETENPKLTVQEKEDPFVELSQRIHDVMKTKQPYLQYEFSLEDLASLLEVPKHHLYYCFRNILHTKFTRLRTEYRIEHAKRLLNETDLSRTTLDAIGKNSGFSSRSGFYNTFKEELGCSPGEYVEGFNHIGTSL
jgi:AraC-like DNA-binding protein